MKLAMVRVNICINIAAPTHWLSSEADIMSPAGPCKGPKYPQMADSYTPYRVFACDMHPRQSSVDGGQPPSGSKRSREGRNVAHRSRQYPEVGYPPNLFAWKMLIKRYPPVR